MRTWKERKEPSKHWMKHLVLRISGWGVLFPRSVQAGEVFDLACRDQSEWRTTWKKHQRLDSIWVRIGEFTCRMSVLRRSGQWLSMDGGGLILVVGTSKEYEDVKDLIEPSVLHLHEKTYWLRRSGRSLRVPRNWAVSEYGGLSTIWISTKIDQPIAWLWYRHAAL